MLRILLLLACLLTALLENYQVCFVNPFIKTQEDCSLCAIYFQEISSKMFTIYIWKWWLLLPVFLYKCEKYIQFLIGLAFLMVFYFCNWTVNKLYI